MREGKSFTASETRKTQAPHANAVNAHINCVVTDHVCDPDVGTFRQQQLDDIGLAVARCNVQGREAILCGVTEKDGWIRAGCDSEGTRTSN